MLVAWWEWRVGAPGGSPHGVARSRRAGPAGCRATIWRRRRGGATAAKVTATPVWSSSRRERIALARVSSWRCRAALMRRTTLWLSGRIGRDLRVTVVFEGCDDRFEVVGDVPVHFDEAGLTTRFGGADDL